MKTIIFPSDPRNFREVDSDYEKEYQVATLLGFKCLLFEFDTWYFPIRKSEILTEIIYRGWMMTPSKYEDFYNILLNLNYKLINDPTQYVDCHWFPNVYDKIKNWTPLAIWTQDLNSMPLLRKHFDKQVLIKDFVKSEKSRTCFKIPVNTDERALIEIVKDFVGLRGKLFQGGIVFKQYVDLKKYDNKTNEWRIFIKDKIIISVNQNSNNSEGCIPSLEFLSNIIPNITSRFYTIDIVELENGEWTIIETGDGGVSGLATNSNVLEFYNKL
jgi:hypothetical protein